MEKKRNEMIRRPKKGERRRRGAAILAVCLLEKQRDESSWNELLKRP